jgi:hypothetical protein
VTKVQVAEALISSISTGFLEEKGEYISKGGQIHFNFAFDENVFKKDHNQLRDR